MKSKEPISTIPTLEAGARFRSIYAIDAWSALRMTRRGEYLEAVDIIKSHNIDFTDGPSLHYLMADAKGESVLVEYYDGEMQVIRNEESWNIATNFLRSSVDDSADGNCWRYDKINTRLTEANGRIDAQAAMQLLADVAQNNTQWSVVYQMNSGMINVVMGQQYRNIHQFQLDLVK